MKEDRDLTGVLLRCEGFQFPIDFELFIAEKYFCPFWHVSNYDWPLSGPEFFFSHLKIPIV